MAKFCTNCGKKLEEGKTCDCQKKEKKEEILNNSSDMLNEYLDALKGIIVKPVDTMKKYTKSSKFNLALIMLLINVIISGLFVYLFAKEFAQDIFKLLLGGYSSLLTGGVSNPEIPISVFFYSVLLMALYYFAFAGLLHLICGPIMKKESDFKEVIGLMGVNVTFTTITTLIALIFIFISIQISLIILLLGGVIFLFNIYRGFTEITKVDKNKMTYAFVCAYVIAIFLVYYVIPKIFS